MRTPKEFSLYDALFMKNWAVPGVSKSLKNYHCTEKHHKRERERERERESRKNTGINKPQTTQVSLFQDTTYLYYNF